MNKYTVKTLQKIKNQFFAYITRNLKRRHRLCFCRFISTGFLNIFFYSCREFLLLQRYTKILKNQSCILSFTRNNLFKYKRKNKFKNKRNKLY